MTIQLPVGDTDVSFDIKVYDDDGLPVTGLVAATFPDIYISKGTGADIGPVSLSDLSALTDAHSDGGIKERGGGVYRFDSPDSIASAAAVAVNVRAETSGKRVIAPTIQVGVDLSGTTVGTVTTVSDTALQLGATSSVNSATIITTINNSLNSAQGEPGQGTPAKNETVLTKIAYLYKAWRNKKTQTADQYSLYADNGSDIDQKAAISDNGTTTTIEEITTGP